MTMPEPLPAPSAFSMSTTELITRSTTSDRSTAWRLVPTAVPDVEVWFAIGCCEVSVAVGEAVSAALEQPTETSPSDRASAVASNARERRCAR